MISWSGTILHLLSEPLFVLASVLTWKSSLFWCCCLFYFPTFSSLSWLLLWLTCALFPVSPYRVFLSRLSSNSGISCVTASLTPMSDRVLLFACSSPGWSSEFSCLFLYDLLFPTGFILHSGLCIPAQKCQPLHFWGCSDRFFWMDLFDFFWMNVMK